MRLDLIPQNMTVNKELIKRNLHNVRSLASEYRDKITYDDSKDAAFLEKTRRKGSELNPHQEKFLRTVQETQLPILKQMIFFAKGILHELARTGSPEEDEIDADSKKIRMLGQFLTDEDKDVLRNLYDIMIDQHYVKANTSDEHRLSEIKKLYTFIRLASYDHETETV
ncbi:MAG: hypothetical protein HY094_07800 [Candidatus Melainabacteria bacterium]|nr:hypothetical protein [Candidatus Melainabacteria bacterium]